MAYRRIFVAVAFAIAVAVAAFMLPGAAGHTAAHSESSASSRHIKRSTTKKASTVSHGGLASKQAHALRPGPNLAPGSNPAVLPGPVLIADKHNNRLIEVSPQGKILWTFPQPGDLAPGQKFLIPDDAFFTPGGHHIIATEEDYQVIDIIDVATKRIVWRYGTPGVPGSGPNQLHRPDDAMELPNGDVVTADIKNCNILVVGPKAHVPLKTIGMTDPYCYHQPPQRWGSPNGVFPMTNGNYLVSEINGDWVDSLNLASGQVQWSTHPPGVAYPSDSNEVSPGVYLTADYSDPGQVVEFNKQGQFLWRYKPAGKNALNRPSLCLPIPTNGYIICNDDHNDRVIVIDPHTNKIVWQYGHTGVPGSAPGYLNVPDGLDLAPPYSFLMIHKATMGLP